MNTTLRIDSALLHEAEQLAKQRNIDLSKAVEAFIRKFIDQPTETKKEIRITPFVERLGVNLGLPADFDEKEAYRKHIEGKYK